MNSLFKNRGAGSYVGLLSAILSLASALGLFFYGQSVKDFLPISFILLLLGVLAAVVAFVTDFSFVSILPGMFYIVAWGLYLKRQLMTISNYFNKIALGNSGSAFQVIMFFLAVILVATLLSVIANFLEQKKS